jgi:hypothetical protein
MKKIVLFMILAILTNHLLAINTFEKKYGGNLDDEGYAVRQTADGGYIIAGMSYSFIVKPAIYLVRTNGAGDTLWTKEYGSLGWGFCRDVIEDEDGGFVICGGINSDVLLFKVDSQGSVLWEKEYGGWDYDEGYSLRKTTDHGFILCGYTKSFGTEYENVYWVKTDSVGDLQWQNSYSGLTVSRGLCVRQTFDGKYIICGYTGYVVDKSSPAPGFLMIKLDVNGDTLWTKTYGGSEAYSVVETADHGYLACGNFQYSSSVTYFELLRTDMDGSLVWMNILPLADSVSEGRWIEKTPDGNYIVGGFAGNSNDTSWKMLLVKTNDSGDTLWAHRFAGISSAAGSCVQPTNDQGFVVCGYTDGILQGQKDVYLVKTDENGIISGVRENPATSGILAWPNPCLEQLMIQSNDDILSVSVLDPCGREVRYADFSTGSKRVAVDFSGLHAGIYVVKITTQSQVILEKIIHI